MSEYQYYEFQAIDRPLTAEERTEIGSWSSRTDPTSTQAVFIYHYGDFPKSPVKVVGEYFDAMLYVANWGTRRLIFRFPRSIIDEEMLDRYCFSETITLSATKDHLILDICFDDEDSRGDWIEGEGWLSSLALLRQDILNGDFRMLYLAWLNAVYLEYDIEDYYDEPEPPVPDNLQNLPAALESFIEFFEIDEDLISVASEGSGGTVGDAPKPDIEKAVAGLPEKERIEFLVRMAGGEQHLNLQLLKRLRELSAEDGKQVAPDIQRRTIGQILGAAEKLSGIKAAQAKQRAEQERIRKLEKLAKRENELWEEVYSLIGQKKAREYDEAVEILRQLRDLSGYLEKKDKFRLKIARIYEDYSRLSAFTYRLDRAGLGK
jgi:hypothetical protein